MLTPKDIKQAPDQRELKDSGERRHYDSGAVRDGRAGKGRFDLLPPHAIFRVARVFEKGAEKYEPRNWELGMPLSQFLDSALRHLFEYVAGMTDEDHLAQAAWNCLAALETEYRIVAGILPSELADLPGQAGLGLREYNAEIAVQEKKLAAEVLPLGGAQVRIQDPCTQPTTPNVAGERDPIADTPIGEMKWTKHRRADRGITEWICPHGVGHPDLNTLPPGDEGIHGCCGCCGRSDFPGALREPPTAGRSNA